MDDDFQLIDAWAAGDHGAAQALIKRHTGALYKFFDRKLDVPTEDLVQETLVACLEARTRVRPEAGFRAYLFGIARHVLFAHLRRRYRDAASLDPDTTCLRELGPTPSEQLDGRHEERLLQEALRWLPVEVQLLLELYYWQGLTAREIADATDAAEPAIRSRLRRAKASLRAAVERVAASPDLLRSTWSDFESRTQVAHAALGRDDDLADGQPGA